MADSFITTPDKGAESEGLRPDMLKFLQEVVTASYKEQADLDESVWRTMPFFAALYGLAVTVIRSIPPHLAFLGDAIAFVASLFYVLSIAAFILAFVYFGLQRCRDILRLRQRALRFWITQSPCRTGIFQPRLSKKA